MSSIRLLALETATEYCSVAVLSDRKIFTRVLHCKNQHAAQLLALLDALLAEAQLKLTQLDALAFGCGPGSFTGVRIGVSITQGLAYGINKPVIPISTLQIMAQQAHQQYGVKHALVALDARMQQIYSGCYGIDAAGLMQPYSEQMLLDPEKFLLHAHMCAQTQGIPLSAWHGVGNGWQIYQAALQAESSTLAGIYSAIEPLAAAALPLARAAYQQGLAIPAALAMPVYLRDDVVN